MKPLKLNFNIIDESGDYTTSDNAELEQALGDTLLRNDNLFIIGSEAIFKTETPGTQNTGDSSLLLFNAIADYINEPISLRPTHEHDWHLWFKQKNMERNICETAWNLFAQKTDLTDFVSEELISFIENGIKYHLLHTIFTTCIDPTLEVIVRAICQEYGKHCTVYNFKGDNQMANYSQDDNENSIVFVYLWGKIGDRENNLERKTIEYVFTEDDAMVTISDYIKKSNDNTVAIFRQVFYNKRIMAIGCRFDDWKFRFFWYSIRGNLDRLSNGTISYSCKTPNDDPLFQYLKMTRGLHVNNNSRQFLNKMAVVMESDSLFEKIRRKRIIEAKGIFLSYPSEDVISASNIFDYFVDKCHFNTWMDTQRLNVTDRYTVVIKEAIRDCGIFVPILSTQVKKDLLSGINTRYYMSEWKEAYMNGRVIVPISIGEYDYREQYHTIFKEMCGFTGINDITVLPITRIDRIANKISEYLSL